MVLILSRRSDYSTNKVIDWLLYFKVSFFRLNDEDLAMGTTKISFNLSCGNCLIIKESQEINVDKISVVWFRKFGFLDSYNDFFQKNEPTSNLNKYIYSEFYKMRTLLFKMLKDKKWLYFKKNMLSKIEVLDVAKKNGLKIPKTIVTNDFLFLKKIFKPCEKIITKSLGEATVIKYKDLRIPLPTKIINLADMKERSFFPSLFQEYIEKEYEIRTFYLDSKFYSMAMFTQKNEKTLVDYRNYDFQTPPRNVPYILPKEIEFKLDILMKKLKINTGSFDLIKSVEGDYVFLEVNPSGQYGMVAYPCNYPIDMLIAKYLKENVTIN